MSELSTAAQMMRQHELDREQHMAIAQRNAKYAIVQQSERVYQLVRLGDASYLGTVPCYSRAKILERGNWSKCYQALMDVAKTHPSNAELKEDNATDR
jgi:hypothetical protein